MTGLRTMHWRWIVAAWIAWPAGLLLAAAVAFYVWLRAQGTAFIDFNIGWQQPTSAEAWAATLLPLALLVTVLFGPPLLLTLLWRRSNTGPHRDRPT